MFRFAAARNPISKRSARGQSMVELALTLPLLILILMGVLDLGRMLDAYVTITNAAREGARFGIDNPTNTSGIKNHVVQEAANSGITILTDKVTVVPPTPTSGNPITVSVAYDFHLMTTTLFAGLQTVPLNSSMVMQVK